jgi:hypothetical protein
MTLIEAVQQLAGLDSDLTIYARPPWKPSAEARLAIEGTDEEKKIRADGLSYFLEVVIAQEFLEDWRSTQRGKPTEVQTFDRLIAYATNDA